MEMNSLELGSLLICGFAEGVGCRWRGWEREYL